MTNHVGSLSTVENYIVFGGVRISGHAAGSMIVITYDEDVFNEEQGADGEVARMNTGKLMATATIRLSPTSLSNDVLSAFHLIDRVSNIPLPFALSDNLGRTKGIGTNAWISKMPDTDQADTASGMTREWKIKIAHWDAYVGGNN